MVFTAPKTESESDLFTRTRRPGSAFGAASRPIQSPLAVASDGRALSVARRPLGDSSISVTGRSPAGVWSEPRPTGLPGQVLAVAIARGGAGVVLSLETLEGETNRYKLHTAVIAPDGTVGAVGVAADPFTGDPGDLRLTTDARGTAILAWTDGGKIVTASAPAGMPLTTDVLGRALSSPFDLVTDDAGRTLLAYQSVQGGPRSNLSIRPAGGRFAAPISPRGQTADVGLAVDRASGAAALVWQSLRSANGFARYDQRFSWITPGGAIRRERVIGRAMRLGIPFEDTQLAVAPDRSATVTSRRRGNTLDGPDAPRRRGGHALNIPPALTRPSASRS
jgi:hypothetical protein